LLRLENGILLAQRSAAMEMDYATSTLRPDAIALPAPQQTVVKKQHARSVAVDSPLARAHLEVARTDARENRIWMLLALATVAILVMSFWIKGM
jgi:hypothetical protein